MILRNFNSMTYQQMYGICTQDSDDNRAQCTDNVACVFERAWHSQYTRTQTGF